MDSSYEQRVRGIDWAPYRTAYGSASKRLVFVRKDGRGPEDNWGSVADQLVRLASRDPAEAQTASHQLWCSLCHQHAYVSSAARPAFPFLLEVLDSACESLQVEILDIVVGIASCCLTGRLDPDGEWAKELEVDIRSAVPRFRALAAHPNEEIADWANKYLQILKEA